MTTIPLERIHNLSGLPDSGYEISVTASPDELQRLAEWAGVDAVSRLHARVKIVPELRTGFLLETEFEADVVQSCVVTLEPVHSHIARSFTRALHLAAALHRHAEKGGMTPPAVAGDDAPEEIESLRCDLAGPLREEFALAIDAYPRAPGVEFEASPDIEEHPDSPFAALEQLKRDR
ncbi:MAG: YceD family protein [Rhizomicrobium sp.]